MIKVHGMYDTPLSEANSDRLENVDNTDKQLLNLLVSLLDERWFQRHLTARVYFQHKISHKVRYFVEYSIKAKTNRPVEQNRSKYIQNGIHFDWTLWSKVYFKTSLVHENIFEKFSQNIFLF